jgi:hypothetical protein
MQKNNETLVLFFRTNYYYYQYFILTFDPSDSTLTLQRMVKAQTHKRQEKQVRPEKTLAFYCTHSKTCSLKE